MDASMTSASSGNTTEPMAFLVASWLGMPREEILRGLDEGWIAPPPGSAPGWTPPASDAATATSDGSGWGPAAETFESAASTDDLQGVAGDSGAATTELRSTVHDWLHAIDPSLADEAVEKLWQSTGVDDAARAAWWRDYLLRALGVSADKSSADVEQVDAAIAAASADPANHATIVPLAGLSGESIADLAKNDAGARYALAQMDPVALTSNRALAAARDPLGAFDRFDPDTGEQLLSDAFIADRSKLVAWKLRQDNGGDLAIAGDERWTFVDRGRIGDDGAPFTLTLEGDQANGATVAHQVVFGTSNSDVIGGASTDDRLYGQAGDDFLRGGAGSDYIEGGQGFDTLAGGRGDDQLVGGAGDDDIDGGSGGDALEGGSGDDALAGGRGNDLLDGGVGDDTYTFEGGDGRDVIVDADGRGHVVLDDIEITGSGASRVADGVWRSADGALEFRYAGTADDPGVLSIRATGSSGSDADEIRIRDWQNGALGITLDEGLDPAADATADSGGEATDWAVPPPGRRSSGVAQQLVGHPATAFFTDIPRDSDVASSLVAPDIVNTAVRAFAGAPEPPDITSAIHAWDGAAVGITPQQVSSAVLDFHDSGDLAIDHAASEPVANLSAILPTMPTTESLSVASTPAPGTSGSGLAMGRASGQRG